MHGSLSSTTEIIGCTSDSWPQWPDMLRFTVPIIIPSHTFKLDFFHIKKIKSIEVIHLVPIMLFLVAP